MKAGEKISLSIVLPVYNEEGVLRNSVQRLRSFMDGLNLSYEIIICDDHSDDGTYREALSLARGDPRIRYLRFGKRIGKGGSIKNCVKVARGSVVLLLDADLPVSLDHIPRVVSIASSGGGSLVIGVRDPASRATQGFLRRFLSHVYNSLVNLFFRTGIRDHQCGFKALPLETAKKIFPRIRCDGFLFDTELIVHVRREGVRIVSMPVSWREPRRSGSKVVPFRAAMSMLADLIVLRLARLFGREILRLRLVNDGFFIDINDRKVYPVTFTRIDGDQRILNILRKIYLAVAFGNRR